MKIDIGSLEISFFNETQTEKGDKILDLLCVRWWVD